MADLRDILRLGLSAVVAPAVKFAIKHSFRIQDFLESVKLKYIAEGEKEIKRAGSKVTVSKLSVMTGIHRRDIMRLWRDGEEPKTDGDLVTRVLGQWLGDKRFLKGGIPKVLTLHGMEGDFKELVFSISQDLNPYTLLFELQRAGLVKVDDNKIRLIRTVRQIDPDELEKGFVLMENDLIALAGGIEQNLIDDKSERNLHIRTEFDSIPEARELEVRQWFLNEGLKFHERASKYLSSLDTDINQTKQDGPKIRAIVGSFSFTTKKE